jgi:ribose-phosphate pyrophosphokinase
VAYATKHRDAGTGKLSSFAVPELRTHKVLIVDDICDGGGTFVGIARALPENHTHMLGLYVTHGLFSRGIGELVKYFTRIFTTDSLLSASVVGVTRYSAIEAMELTAPDEKILDTVAV